MKFYLRRVLLPARDNTEGKERGEKEGERKREEARRSKGVGKEVHETL